MGLQRWFPEALEQFGVITVFDLLQQYIREGRITVDPSRHPQLATYHDACNYGRRSEMLFGHGYYEEPREILDHCVEQWVDLHWNRGEQICCGGGGGALATPYGKERMAYGKRKVDQIAATGAELLVVPCHSCHEQIKRDLRAEYGLETLQVKYLWELVADAIVP